MLALLAYFAHERTCHAVVQLADAVAEQLGLAADRKRNIEFAALLHDVGKIAVPMQLPCSSSGR
ncbi:MAG: HD domain-containing protein [Solirubrobacteraceae bacterium]